MNQAYIALGSNIGDRLKNLTEAITSLSNREEIVLVTCSSIYDTEPVGFTEQDPFLNMVILIETSLSAVELLHICLAIEQDLGRKRELRWGPRIIDLDILLYNQENIETKELVVPHPRMHERAFVLTPLLEINPSLKIAKRNQSLQFFLEQNSEKEGVRIWKRKNGEDVFALFVN